MNPMKTKPANREETDAYNDLAAAHYCICYVEGVMRERLRLIPGGWRDLRLMRTLAEKLLKSLLSTFEEQKRRQIQKNAQYCRVKFRYGPEASRDPEMHLILSEDLGYIMVAALDTCQTCLGTAAQCKSCRLGKALDRVSFVSRGDDPWWVAADKTQREEKAS